MVPQTSWSDLPMEMLAEVVKHLDFKSRMQLRATARLEKKMVESWRRRSWIVLKVDCVYINFCCNDVLEVWIDDKSFHGSFEKMSSLVCSLINYTKIRQFQISTFIDLPTNLIDLLEKMTEDGNFKFPILNVDHFNDQDFPKLMEWCTPGSDLLHFHYPPKQGFEKVLGDNSPVMLEASVIQLSGRDDDFTLANTIVEAWLRNDQHVGKKILWYLGWFNDENHELEYVGDIRPSEDRALSTFKDRFGERLVAETAKSARIRMDDESKHIVVRIVNEEDGRDTEVVAIWEVVPADLLEENFDKASGYVLVEC